MLTPVRKLTELSYGQQRMWFLNRLDPASPVHNTITQVPLPSPPDLPALRWATNEVIARHAPLRTRYLTVDDDPRAEIDPIVEVDVEIDPDPTEFVRRPFDLTTGPVVRVCALRDRSLALVCVHHIATDGWSMRNFVRELAQLYRARTAEVRAAPPGADGRLLGLHRLAAAHPDRIEPRTAADILASRVGRPGAVGVVDRSASPGHAAVPRGRGCGRVPGGRG